MTYNIILNGRFNCTEPTTCETTIGGGSHNRACTGAWRAGIFSGADNTVSNYNAVILGGSGNNDNGFNYAGIFGQNVAAVANNTFHVECINAINTPAAGGGLPSGTFAFVVASGAGTVPTGAKVLVLI